MLKLTTEKPIVGSWVGYTKNYLSSEDKFEEIDIGIVMKVYPHSTYEVKFNDNHNAEFDIYSESQLTLITL